MQEVVSGRPERIILALLNVGMRLCGFIFALLVIVFDVSGFLTVYSCLVVALLTTCSFFVLVYWWKVAKLPLERVQAFLTSDDETDHFICHRGCAFDSPENTLRAFEQAKQNGAFAVEVDVGITKDGVAVLLHDWTVDRTTDGKGMLSEMTYEEARRLNAAAKFARGPPFSTEPIPTLEECVLKCHELDLKILLDIKDNSDKAVSILAELYREHPHLIDSGMVCSFRPSLIYKLRLRNPGILTALTMTSRFFQHELDQLQEHPWRGAYFLAYILDRVMMWSMYNWLWYLCGNAAVLLNKDAISGSVIDYWRDRGILVVPWTVNKPEEKKYFHAHHKLPVITDTLIHEADG